MNASLEHMVYGTSYMVLNLMKDSKKTLIDIANKRKFITKVIEINCL